MTSENLYEAIGDISDKKIKEAKQVRKSKQPSWIKWGAMVACLCLVVVGSTILLKQDFNTQIEKSVVDLRKLTRILELL